VLRALKPWLGRIRERKADPAAAVAACDAAIADCGSLVELHALRSLSLARLKHDAAAEPDFRLALPHRRENPKYLITFAESLVRLGRYGEAIELFESAIAIEPRPKWSDRLVELLLGVGDYVRASATLERMIESEPRQEARERHRDVVSRLQADREAGVSPTVKAVYGEALECLRWGHPVRANTLLESVVRACPVYAPAWVALRGARLAGGRDEAAARVEAEWTSSQPTAAHVARAGCGRRLSPRGLLFDTDERFAVVRKETALTAATSPEALRTVADSYWIADPGGTTVTHRPFIDLGDGAEGQVVQYQTAPTFMASIRHAMVVGRGAVLTAKGHFVEDLHVVHRMDKYSAQRHGAEVVFDREAYFGGLCPVTFFDRDALLLAGPTDLSFGDWVMNFPPRLAVAAAAGLDCPIVVNRHILPQYVDMLEALGVNRERLLFHDPAGVSVFPRLYVPSWPAGDRLRPMKGWNDVYRSLAMPGGPSKDLRLYLSRSHNARRQLLNEPEICQIFARHGFQVVYPERLPLAETIDLFSRAAVVAAPYGSALRNIAFAPSHPVALVLMPPSSRVFRYGAALWLAEAGARLAFVPSVPADPLPFAEDELPNQGLSKAPWVVAAREVERAIALVLAAASKMPA
jgi:capsular polysaccharide biosynthesis protein